MKSLLIAPIAALIVAASVPAFAGERGDHFSSSRPEVVRHEVDAVVARTRSRLEERLRWSHVSVEHARRERARFNEATVRLERATHRATADGVVTPREEREIRALSAELES